MSKKRFIRDILILHDFEKNSGQLWAAEDQIRRLSDWHVNDPRSTCTIVYADGLDSPEKIRQALAGYASHEYKDDLFLLLTRASDPEADAVIVKTRSGYTIVGPNDGSLSCVLGDIEELRVILEPCCYNEFARRISAAASIAQGRPWDEFSRLTEPGCLKTG